MNKKKVLGRFKEKASVLRERRRSQWPTVAHNNKKKENRKRECDNVNAKKLLEEWGCL